VFHPWLKKYGSSTGIKKPPTFRNADDFPVFNRRTQTTDGTRPDHPMG